MTMDSEFIKSVFSPPPCLETERLLLRAIKPRDADDMFEYSSDSEVTRYLTWEPHSSKRYTRLYISGVENAYRRGAFFDWALVLRANGKMIGTCGFTSFDEQRSSCEIGYVLNPRYRGYGLAPEAAFRVIRFAFEVLGARRVEAKFMEGNTASLRVMEKCGMRFEKTEKNAALPALAKGKRVDVGVCSLTLGEYLDMLSQKNIHSI